MSPTAKRKLSPWIFAALAAALAGAPAAAAQEEAPETAVPGDPETIAYLVCAHAAAAPFMIALGEKAYSTFAKTHGSRMKMGMETEGAAPAASETMEAPSQEIATVVQGFANLYEGCHALGGSIMSSAGIEPARAP